MGQYLIDNNIISGYFSGKYTERIMSTLSQIIDQMPNISVITQIEALSWVDSDKNKEAILKSFISECNIIPLTNEVVMQCIKLRRSYKIKTPDAIIAATSIVFNLGLLTNDSDFRNIKNVRVFSTNDL